MYFVNDKHKENYDFLMRTYYLTREKAVGIQYEANIYIAAYPSIYECIDINTLKTSSGPLFMLTYWDDEQEKHRIDASGLTGSTRRLVEVGLSLYNGYKISLDDVFSSILSEELIAVFFQACKIRGRC
ncbi:hypothetical protein ACQVWH_10490 [Bacillus toyonensis]|nr:hypothetical protein [Bacillus toyonensis]MCH5452424.1 hypothetical protein [Bacillus toyonensis]HDR7414561.1 hypothetical protein [Bacillus toyonensis]